MPRIIVRAEPGDRADDAPVTLEERVSPAHLETDHSCAALIERLGWAVLDAEAVERSRAA